MKKVVIIKVEVEGFHCYPAAPQEVQFLSNNHRHSFAIQVAYYVSSSDREKEIFIYRDKLRSFLVNSFGVPCQFGERSCEWIAETILNEFKELGGVWCEVWEENTGGARVEI